MKREEIVEINDRVSMKLLLSEFEPHKSESYSMSFLSNYIWNDYNPNNMTIESQIVGCHLKCYALLDGKELVESKNKPRELFFRDSKFSLNLCMFQWKEAIEVNLKLADALNIPLTYGKKPTPTGDAGYDVYLLNGNHIGTFDYPLPEQFNNMVSEMIWGELLNRDYDQLTVKKLVQLNIEKEKEQEQQNKNNKLAEAKRFEGFEREIIYSKHNNKGQGEDEHYTAKVKITGNGETKTFIMNNWCDAGFVCNGENSLHRDFAIKKSPIPTNIFL